MFSNRLYTLGAALLFSAGARATEELSHTIFLTPQEVPWSDSVSFPHFDPALGELQAVRLTARSDQFADVSMENLCATPETYLVGISSVLAVDLQSGVLGVPTLIEQSFRLGPFDNQVDFAGDSGGQFFLLQDTGTGETTEAPGPDYSNLIVSAEGSLSTDGNCFNFAQQISNRVGGQLTLTYLYTPRDCNLDGVPDSQEPDCDGNGIPDLCEPDCDGDGTPDVCSQPCMDSCASVGANLTRCSLVATVGLQGLPFSEFPTFPRFDPLNPPVPLPPGTVAGQLVDVEVEVALFGLGDLRFENLDASPALLDYETVLDLLALPGGNTLQAQLVFAGSEPVEGFDGDVDFAGDSGRSVPFFAGNAYGSVNAPPAAFEGVGQVAVPVSVQRAATVSGANTTLVGDAGAQVTITVSYTFETGPDCNFNGIPDDQDIANGTSQDCDQNGVPDECQPDCDVDGIPDACEPDCDADAVPDDCEPDCDFDGTPDDCEPDCDNDGTPDDCEPDCDFDGTPDDCEPDCDNDGLPDDCEPDCDADGLPDDCEVDCNGNGVPDDCDASPDCNGNGIPDDCEPDCDMDAIPDDCEPDCDNDGIPDDCESDCSGNGIPDDCESDCDNDGTPDDCEPDCDNDGTPDDCEGGVDCNMNGVPDECEPDCDMDGIPDDCQLGQDCNQNGVPDVCDPDCDMDGIPDDCEPDCNMDGIPDDCQSGADCDQNGVPDYCDPDCDSDGLPDACEPDCDNDGTPDDCEPDCDGDGTPDDCEPDSDGDGVPDDCDSPAPVATSSFQHAGSLLIFHRFETRAGASTLLTVTNTGNREVIARFKYYGRDGTNGQDLSCLPQEVVEVLTARDTFSAVASFHSGVFARGFVTVEVEDLQGNAIVDNSLIGSALHIDGLDVYEGAVNAVSLKGLGARGDFTDVDADGLRDLDGVEYEPLAEELLFPRYLATELEDSELILLGMTGGSQFTTTVELLVFNDNEELFSLKHAFQCWEQAPLTDLSLLFSNAFLQNATAHDPSESLGFVEYGWMAVQGLHASSSSASVASPALLGALIERTSGGSMSASQPLYQGIVTNGDLFPNSLFGDQ